MSEKKMCVILNNKDRERLETIKRRINEIEAGSRAPIVPYTPHGVSHSQKLEKLLDVLLPGEESVKVNKIFNDKERFLLLAAIWLHDIGMYPQLFNDDPNPATWNSNDLEEWDREVLRKTHHERSERYILENFENLNLEKDEYRHLAFICRYHRRSQKLPTKHVDKNILLITAYLRLLDAFHIPDRPSPTELNKLRTFLAYGMDPISKFNWYRSFYVSKIESSPTELKLTIKFVLPQEWKDKEEKMSPLVRAIETDLRDELDAVKDILIEGKVKYDLPAYIYVDHSFELTPLTPQELDELESLLAIIELFDPTISPNSGELIKIVLDGLEKCVDINKVDPSIKALRTYHQNILYKLLEHRSCHVYLWKVYEWIDNQMREFSNTSSTAKKEELLKNVQIMIKALKEKRKDLNDELPRAVLNALKINNNDVIFVYGYSNSVVAVLGALRDDVKKNIEVVVCECSPKTKHRYDNKLIYCDGIQYLRKLKEKGIEKIYYVPDISASNLFSKGILFSKSIKKGSEVKEKIKKITKVFFGANGIDKNTGEVAHALGHLAIADMAKKHQIPVYVIAESMKIGKLTANPKNQRKEPWYPTDVLFDDVSEVNSYNPREDIVVDITGILTEKGSSPPNRLDEISSNIEEIIENYKRKYNL